MDRQSVLIADDDAALAENVAEILEALDTDVSVVSTGAEALALAQRRSYDLALVDVRLPDADGTELIARLRAASPSTEVVLITGDASVESAMAAVQGGAFAYLLKPVSPPDLLDTSRRALAQVALRRERERLQRELERSERRHREVVEAVPALVIALDGHGRIALWNRRLEELTGFARAEMLGRPGSDLIKQGGVRPLALKVGGERLVRWERAEVGGTDAEETWVYAVGTDVTAEQEMLRRALRAERLAAVGTLAAGLAHEVRNPLNSALLQLQVLVRRMDREDARPETMRPIADIVEQEIRRLERLVNDFLAFVQPRPLALQPTALADLCRSVLEFVRPEADSLKVHLTADLDTQAPTIAADPERLRQVLLNLVRNALEAMNATGGDLVVRTRAAGGSAEIDIEDSGPGFGDEAPVFDAFFTTKPQGTGLGLTIVHRIVTDHGGTIRVSSRPGRTCFTISLPSSSAATAR
jgi:signal transduction histidine kinase